MVPRSLQKQRIIPLDALRILACIMVVTMHAPLPGDAENGLFLSSLSYLTAPGVGLFFMISGALLLPIKGNPGSFLKKRLLRIAIPLFVWSLIYLIVESLSGTISLNGNPTYWFLFSLAGLYLLAPILSRWLVNASRKEVEFYLCLWGIGLLLPALRPILAPNTGTSSIIYYFLGYAGYFVLGYYLKTFPNRIRFRHVVPAMGLALLAPVLCKLLSFEVDFYSVFWYLSIFVVIQCVFWWKTAFLIIPSQLADKTRSILIAISQMTFGIYLVHYLLIRKVLWKWAPIQNLQPYPLQAITIAITAIFGSLLLVWLIRYLPYSDKWLGTSSKKCEQ